jgi:tRNA nucleotidyltransferase (CCA-adding enzyme)
MRIILTHEQADFDALASLLGAYLLDEGATPVLPRRMNRNVRAFLTLYGAELPFVDPVDLPVVPIEEVTLVDTQSMVSIRGMSEATRVHLIDHHPLRDDLPKEWAITVSGTGANTTLFVETLREREAALSTVQSTLLLLGIYEDTGSLTYDHTTPRDLRAASYLLEQAASLQIAANFLNHPLSKEQQALYDHLRQTVEYYHIHGYTILVACGNAREMDEELSTVAHKLRDLLDPDALYLLITTRGGVQLIARSTTDNIDVAELAAYFGGGGHERAAACLIKDRPLEDVHKELIAVLPNYIQPAVTVAQIMSPDPHLLAADTPVEEAALRMQRYGYEGFPVVQGGKLVGLLTRRAVDRALSHKIPKIAASLMDAGEYTVQPGDSIEHLQRLMTDTGWGQIPVVDPSSGKIIGIVTRTDLLKTLSPRPRTSGRQNLAERLEDALPPERLALLKAVAGVAHEQKVALYIVGGFVRDLLLEHPSLDFDLVVEGDAIALARALSRRYGGRVTSHTRFGTAKWFLHEARLESKNLRGEKGQKSRITDHEANVPHLKSLDLITARTEFYTHPTALPTVERSSVKLDLHRRDFTINTLALRLDGRHYGELYDYWGGLADLRQGLVRVLHSLSFVDDPTRMLRAVRFEQRFGFRIDQRTLELLHEAVPLLEKVSGDRVRHELDHILVEDRLEAMLVRLDELKLLGAIHAGLVLDDWFRNCLKMAQAASKEPGWPQEIQVDGQLTDLLYILWLLRLPAGIARGVIARLKFSAVLSRTLLAARELWKDLPTLEGASPSTVVDRLDGVPLQAIQAVYIACKQAELRQLLVTYIDRWGKVKPTINGHDLRLRGLPPGPAYRKILKTLRDAWLDGEISTEEEEAALLDRMIVAVNRHD